MTLATLAATTDRLARNLNRISNAADTLRIEPTVTHNDNLSDLSVVWASHKVVLPCAYRSPETFTISVATYQDPATAAMTTTVEIDGPNLADANLTADDLGALIMTLQTAQRLHGRVVAALS